jgi:hypothetical protein
MESTLTPTVAKSSVEASLNNTDIEPLCGVVAWEEVVAAPLVVAVPPLPPPQAVSTEAIAVASSSREV